jgi:methyltransferase
MSPPVAVALIALSAASLMMLVESQLSRFNERTLRARGATEPADDVYPTMTWMYPGCFVAMAIEGALSGPAPGANTVFGVALFGLAKALKFWAIAALGSRWTFRVLVPPGAPLVTGGPYAWVRHPNYVAVVGEFVSFAILVGAPLSGVGSVIGFGALLRRRIRVEERALGMRRPGGPV